MPALGKSGNKVKHAAQAESEPNVYTTVIRHENTHQTGLIEKSRLFRFCVDQKHPGVLPAKLGGGLWPAFLCQLSFLLLSPSCATRTKTAIYFRGSFGPRTTD